MTLIGDVVRIRDGVHDSPHHATTFYFFSSTTTVPVIRMRPGVAVLKRAGLFECVLERFLRRRVAIW